LFKRGRWQTGFVLASFLSLSTVIIVNESRSGDLSRWYTDHLHHNFATWVLFHKGLDVYTQPFSVAWQGVSYPQASYTWEHNPMVYPPGVFAVFLPTTLLGAWVPMSTSTFGKVNVLYLLLWAHFALWWVMRALAEQMPGARSVVLAVSWMYLARLGLQGFFDSTWIAAGAWMLYCLSKGDAKKALIAFSCAALLHYRAVVLAPLGLWALWQVLRGQPVRQWPWPHLGFAGVAVFLCLGTFALMYPVTARFRGVTLPLIQMLDSHFWIVVIATVIAAALAAWLADPVVAVITCIAGFLGVIHVNFWWHGSVLLFAPLAVDVARTAAQASVTRAILLSWIFCAQPLAWRDHPGQVIVELADHFRLARSHN